MTKFSEMKVDSETMVLIQELVLGRLTNTQFNERENKIDPLSDLLAQLVVAEAKMDAVLMMLDDKLEDCGEDFLVYMKKALRANITATKNVTDMMKRRGR